MTDQVKPNPIVVADGDTLESLEVNHQLDEGTLYAVNAKLLDDEARARGFYSSEEGRLIFPGTTLEHPEPPKA